MKIEENQDLSSDHSPVLLTLSDSIIERGCNPMLVNKLTDWDNFKIEIDNRIQLNVPLKTTDHLEKETENLVEIIQQAAWKNTPDLKRKTVGNNYPQ